MQVYLSSSPSSSSSSPPSASTCSSKFWPLILSLLHGVEASDDVEDEYKMAQRRHHSNIIVYIVVTISFLICMCIRRQLCKHITSSINHHEAEQASGDQPIVSSITIVTTSKLDKTVIDSFSVIQFPPPNAESRFTSDCHICLEEYTQVEGIVVLPFCAHAYHKECIVCWMSTRDSRCPDCRHDYGLAVN